MSTVLRGTGVSGGVALGRVVLLDPVREPVVPEAVPPERIEDELRRFHDARARAREELEVLRERTRDALGEGLAGILDAQILILSDPKLVEQTTQHIRMGRVSASWALKETVHAYLRRFEAIEDTYFRERGGDLQDVHQRLQRLLRSDPSPEHDAAGEDGPTIVVAHTLGPSDSVALTRRDVAALVTDVGGRTSHTAILAQALAVPAVVGLRDVTRHARPGQRAVVDGIAGTVTLDPDPDEVRRAERLARQRVEDDEAVEAGPDLATADGVAITLRANVEFVREVARARRMGARGVGLYRSEFLFLQRAPRMPTEDEHYGTYRDLAAAMAPDPVTVRTLDLGGEKYFHEVLDQGESNPVLGLRGVRLCLERPDIFRPQLRGLLRAAAEHDLRLMIPLVTFVDEIRAVRRLVAEEAARLADEGTPHRAHLPVGVMIEVPAAAHAADLLAREADFFSIGTNDLIQYALAVDRGNASVAYLYQPLHPAVLRMLRFVADAGREAGIPVSLCGEMAADPALTEVLIGLGITELSVQPGVLGAIRKRIREIDAARARDRVARAMSLGSTAEIVAFLGVAGNGRDG